MINIPLLNTITGVFKDIFGIVDQLVEDKDKKNELVFKMMEMQNALSTQLLQQQTTPWVDATVKLLFALRDIIIPLFRPIVAAAMAGYVVYAETNGVIISPVVEAIFAGAFPGWMTSRHLNKKK